MQVSILEQLPPHDPLSAHVQVLVVNNQQPPEAHTVLAQAQQRFGSHSSVRFASSPGCNPVYSRLQPCVLQAATLCTTGCNPVYSRCASSPNGRQRPRSNALGGREARARSRRAYTGMLKVSPW